MKKIIIIIVLTIFLSSCATINFSSKYYTLPTDYKKDIDEVWNDIILKVPLKYKNSYSYKITKDHETSIAGVPQIYQGAISLPEYFIKYIWEFYYPDYHKAILVCTIAHEMAHTESGISDKPPYEHHRCDIYALNNIIAPYFPYGLNHFYSSLVVIGQYWSARKGVGGHLFNIGWNTLNLYAIAMGGSGTVGDLFATDISNRLSLYKTGNPSAKFIFKHGKNIPENKNNLAVYPPLPPSPEDILNNKPNLPSLRTLGENITTLKNEHK